MSIKNKAFSDEFAALFRFRLFSYYKLYTVYTPNPHRVNAEGFDSVEELRKKMQSFIKFHAPAMVPEDEFDINYTPPVKELHTVRDFKDYIANLNKTLSGYEIKRIFTGDTLEVSMKKFETRIWNTLAEHGITSFIDPVLEVIQDLIQVLELDDKETNGFYRDLVNNAAAKAGFFSVLEQTIEEFLSHPYPDQERIAITNMVSRGEHCGCTGKDNKPKSMYPRRSFALVVALNDIEMHYIDSLKIYECGKKIPLTEHPGAPMITIYHLTKQSY